MNETTLHRRAVQLYKQIKNHPHRNELLQLIAEQQRDDVADTCVNNNLAWSM